MATKQSPGSSSPGASIRGSARPSFASGPWALPHGAAVLDLGCGHGVPVSAALIELGFDVHAIDAAPTMVAEFQRRFPGAPVACEAVQTSDFFGRTFDAAVMVGLLFLLDPEQQAYVIRRIGPALAPSGRFLFTAPAHACAWTDVLTPASLRSLGSREYVALLGEAGFVLRNEWVDEGGNHYFDARVRTPGMSPA